MRAVWIVVLCALYACTTEDDVSVLSVRGDPATTGDYSVSSYGVIYYPGLVPTAWHAYAEARHARDPDLVLHVWLDLQQTADRVEKEPGVYMVYDDGGAYLRRESEVLTSADAGILHVLEPVSLRVTFVEPDDSEIVAFEASEASELRFDLAATAGAVGMSGSLHLVHDPDLDTHSALVE